MLALTLRCATAGGAAGSHVAAQRGQTDVLVITPFIPTQLAQIRERTRTFAVAARIPLIVLAVGGVGLHLSVRAVRTRHAEIAVLRTLA